MTPFLIALLFFAGLIAFGRWRRFNSIQWIWLIAGSAFVLLAVWLLALIFIVGPEMRRTLGQ